MADLGSFRFLDLPVEIQQLIIWKCLEGWQATVETHEKESDKSTTRLWSSRIYDALMLSLTCKNFHATIQKFQKDPTLFSGRVDLIEANADATYFVGYLTRVVKDMYGEQYHPKPWPLFRTQIFIKAQTYDRTEPSWRETRIAYHAGARHWLIENTRSLALHADELGPRLSWDTFPTLNHVTIYWPHVTLHADESTLSLCQNTKEDLLKMAQDAANNDLHSYLGKTIVSLWKLWERNIRVTLRYHVIHFHVPGHHDCNLSDHEHSHVRNCFRRLELQITSDTTGDEWKLDHAFCEPTPVNDELDQTTRSKYQRLLRVPWSCYKDKILDYAFEPSSDNEGGDEDGDNHNRNNLGLFF